MAGGDRDLACSSFMVVETLPTCNSGVSIRDRSIPRELFMLSPRVEGEF